MNSEEQQRAETLLRTTTPAALLRTFAALTHRIDHTQSVNDEIEARRQRQLVEREILRRMT